MNELPYISVIIPAHNAADTIRETLESVALQQSLRHAAGLTTDNGQRTSGIEVIVVDDASDDNTVDIVKSIQSRKPKQSTRSSNICSPAEPGANSRGDSPVSANRRDYDSVFSAFSARDINLRLLSLDRNSGPAAARNRGIAEAKGEWLAFLDADDAWLPERLEIGLKLMEQYPDAAMFCGETVRFQSSEEISCKDAKTQREQSSFGNQVCSHREHRVHGENQDAVNAASASAQKLPASHCVLRRTSRRDREIAGPDRDMCSPAELGKMSRGDSHVLRPVKYRIMRDEEGSTNRRDNDSVFSASSARDKMLAVRRLTLEDFAISNPVATSTVLVRKSAIEAAGGFDESFRGPEDYDLWMRIAAGYPVMKTDAPLARYRETPGSLSMDDRTFLPEVLLVLDKAFGRGGALSGYGHLRDAAISTQLWNASWMAFNRGARLTAVRYLLASYFWNLKAEQRVSRQWFRLLARYMFGRCGSWPQRGTRRRQRLWRGKQKGKNL